MGTKKRTSSGLNEFASRIAALPTRHQEACQEFSRALTGYVEGSFLTDEQAQIVMEHVVRLGERERNATNTGNLLDLFCSTLEETKDPLRAFAQTLADSVKVVPMPHDTGLMPPMKDIRPDSATKGAIFRAVKELPLGPPQQMLSAHTNVAYADEEMAKAARAMIRACKPEASTAEAERLFYRMAMQSQHMPSSSFVLAAAAGLHFQVAELFEQAGCSPAEISAAERFYEVSAHFNPKWLALFMNPGPRDDPAYRAWLDEYHSQRAGLPDELRYQLISDTLTNFGAGTMNSGKWVDATVQFGGVMKVEDVPAALAKIVNQYQAEFEDLHRARRDQFVSVLSPTLTQYGVIFDKQAAVWRASPTAPPKHTQMAQQFEDAWHKKIVSGVLTKSGLFQRLGEALSTKLLECFERVVFSSGEVILEEGQTGLGLFVIVEGNVTVSFPSGTNGDKDVPLSKGEVFGEISLLSDDLTTAKVTAAGNTVALVLRPKRFRSIVNRYSDMKDFLVKLAEERLAAIRASGSREWRVFASKPPPGDDDCGDPCA